MKYSEKCTQHNDYMRL